MQFGELGLWYQMELNGIDRFIAIVEDPDCKLARALTVSSFSHYALKKNIAFSIH